MDFRRFINITNNSSRPRLRANYSPLKYATPSNATHSKPISYLASLIPCRLVTVA